MPTDQPDQPQRRGRTVFDMGQLERLAQPIPADWIETKNMGGGRSGSYVNHGVVKQRVLAALGATVDVTIVEWLRGPIGETHTGTGDNAKVWPAVPDAIVGVVLQLTAEVDGRATTVQDVGTPEGAYLQPHDGERAKRAVSDAYKRCAAQLGVALELWSKGPHPLPVYLNAKAVHDARSAAAAEAGAAPVAADQVDPDDVHSSDELDVHSAELPTSDDAPDYAVRWLRAAGPQRTAEAIRLGTVDRGLMAQAATVLDSTDPIGNWATRLAEALAAQQEGA